VTGRDAPQPEANDGGAALGLIAPDLNGPPTGGTLYNAGIFAALNDAGVHCAHFGLEQGVQAVARAAARVFVIDSLYLDAVPRLRRSARAGSLHLLLHYLPSLVEHGRELEPAELSAMEREALAAADGFVVTSAFMDRVLAKLAVNHRHVMIVEPGVSSPPGRERDEPGLLRAVMLCNVVAGKGVQPLLAALATCISNGDRFELWIAGRLDLEPSYADGCRALVLASPSLRTRVRLLGPLLHPQALALLSTASVFLSASQMESYGMALAEARAAGVPIIARAGGHAAMHVDGACGGALVEDELGVAAELLELARKPDLLARRRHLAAAGVRARSWPEAAADLIAQLETAGHALR
jgi:glycosyltransferase involved in cell wall biosynthesis